MSRRPAKEWLKNNFPILAADDRSIQGATRSACPGIDGTGGNGDNRGDFFVASVISVSKGSTMHPLFPRASGITHDVIGAAMEVHKAKDPGLLPLGLVVHFHALKWTDGVSRLILPWANLE